MSRNPYHAVDQLPRLWRSVFVLMDILGYADMIRRSEQDGTQAELFQHLYRALSDARKWLEDRDLPEEFKKRWICVEGVHRQYRDRLAYSSRC